MTPTWLWCPVLRCEYAAWCPLVLSHSHYILKMSQVLWTVWSDVPAQKYCAWLPLLHLPAHTESHCTVLRYSSSVQAVENSSTYVHIVRYDLLLCSCSDTWDITSDKLLLLREIKETFNKTGCTFSHSSHVTSHLIKVVQVVSLVDVLI